MEMVLFVGIQASGKSGFYKEVFYQTHLRLNLDMLRTRHREKILMDSCFQAKQPFVIDNTNPTVAEREKYIREAKKMGFAITGYYFKSSIGAALTRNAQRQGKARVPDVALKATHRQLVLPSRDEGFDSLYYVQLIDGRFTVEVFNDEI